MLKERGMIIKRGIDRNMEEAEKWWEKAKEDLETAEYNLKGDMLNAAAFFAQQAVEKALKSLEIKKLGKFEKVHDLVLLAKHVNAPGRVIELSEKITPFYTITRYPDVEISYNKGEVSFIIKASNEVLEWVKRELK